ncbi:hypothetical protein AB4162_10545 [Vibrio sp. 10N.286.52.B1]|uniref:hypothetical protein n=1 Tax=unclassified Vibrio TaxID=2614977 RepID=UPI0010BE15B9|nr:hypothetical protein [Vibrio sp. F13]TKF72314.1 hypothetical protein FCV59_15140 [Vibrio sp. F13]
MRHIDKSKFAKCKTKTWDKKSKQWSDRVKGAAEPSAEIKAIGNKWSSLKRTFVAEFGAKCWYTESPQIGTDFDVDHYWPKGRVKDAAGVIVKQGEQQHPGYWWKAYDINNYRYSCIFANRARDEGGKVDYFPINDESMRCWDIDAPCDYIHHLILDPCCLDDVKLLSFEVETGQTSSAVTYEENPIGFEKVRLSKTLLNLDHETITPHRLQAIKDVQSSIMLLKLTSGLNDADLNDEYRHGIAEAKERLKNLCNRKSSFSAAAIQHILPNKNAPYLADVVGELDLTP